MRGYGSSKLKKRRKGFGEDGILLHFVVRMNVLPFGEITY